MNLVDYEVRILLGVIHQVVNSLSSSEILVIKFILFAYNFIMTFID